MYSCHLLCSIFVYLISKQVFHRVLFPTKNSLPGVIFHDNNCHVKTLIDNMGDTHFDNCALPVDVCIPHEIKAQGVQHDCNHKCNPALFPA